MTPLSTVAFVGIAAAVGLGISQFFDYHGVAVDAPNYAVRSAASPTCRSWDTETAGSAHLWVLIPVAVAAVVLIIGAYRGERRLAGAVAICGLLGLGVALAIDLPQGLDAGRQGIAFSGAQAQLLQGFWAEVACSAILMLCGGLLALYSRGVTAERRGWRAVISPRPSADRVMRGRPRTETLLVLSCAAAAAMLGVSQFTDIFHLTPPGGEALKAIQASDQHGYATLVLAIFALILLVVAMAARGEQLGQVAAVAIAVCGVVALLIFLIGDLPKVNNVGTLHDPRQPSSTPRRSPWRASGSSWSVPSCSPSAERRWPRCAPAAAGRARSTAAGATRARSPRRRPPGSSEPAAAEPRPRSRFLRAMTRSTERPYPPFELATRVRPLHEFSEPIAAYEQMGAQTKEALSGLLPDGWSFEGKKVLDFGCGAGRTLRHFLAEAETAELWGSDLDAASIEWLETNLCPPLHAWRSSAGPPLGLEHRSFDLIWAISVFTHLTLASIPWLLELHRLLNPDGLLIATYYGRWNSDFLAGEPWDENRIGMNILHHNVDWDHGGPVVLMSDWWVREHWGRAFEVLEIEPQIDNMSWALLRKRDVDLTIEDIERPSDDPREYEAVRHNLRQVRSELDEQTRQSAVRLNELRSDYESSLSWRITRPLRALKKKRRQR